jgi:hypothetical protein
MANDQAIQRLVSLRAAVGAGAWLAPRMSGRLFGLDVAGNPQAPYLGRLFGARDVALAVGLRGSQGPERAQWLRVGMACDLADAVAGLLASRRGELPKPATVLVTATALAAAGLGAAALRGEQSAAPAETPAAPA